MPTTYEQVKEGFYIARFPSLSHAVDQAFGGQLPDERNRLFYSSVAERAPRTWTNGHDKQSILDALENPPPSKAGFDEALAKIEALHGEENKRKMFYNQEDGEELAPLAWIMREPNGWTTCKRIKRPTRRTYRIGVNLASHCQREASELYARGAAALALANAIEATGNRAEIVAYAGNRNFKPSEPGCIFAIEIKLKEADQPANEGTLALALADIGFYRVAILALMSTCTNFKHDSRHGCEGNLPEEEKAKFDIFLSQEITTPEKAVEEIKKQIAKLKEAAQ